MSVAAPQRFTPRGGPGYWLGGFAAMLRWHLAGLRIWAAVVGTTEILSGVGLVFGIGLLVPHISQTGALYGTTGAAVITLLLIGLIFGPQLIAQRRTERTYEYLLGLPVARSADTLSWYVVTLAIGAPAAAVTLVVGALRFDLSYTVSATIVPAVLLTVFAATMLGQAIAHVIEKPMVTIILTQIFVFLAFGYAPINFPADQMPHWLVQLNRGLPFLPMATVMRAALAPSLAAHVAESYGVLSAWAVGSAALATLALRRRR